jgi:hypothetical protein
MRLNNDNRKNLSLLSDDCSVYGHNFVCGVMWPNDQKLSHAAGDSRQPETRSEN